MDAVTKLDVDQLFGSDDAARNQAFHRVIATTDHPVDWAYDIWGRTVNGLTDKDSHVRAISAQLLCNLAKSDPDSRMLTDFDALLQVTRDPRFVTARHCLQNIWKVGVVGTPQREVLMRGLQLRYAESRTEKNGTLIRFDIHVDLAQLYEAVSDTSIIDEAFGWIDEEPDPRYRKKFAAVWKRFNL